MRTTSKRYRSTYENQQSDFLASRHEVKWSSTGQEDAKPYMWLWRKILKPKSPTIRSSRRGSQNPSDLNVITLPSRIPALSWNMPVRNNQLNYRIKPIFTVYSRSLITISLNSKRINSCLSLFHCSVNLKILQFVWFIANCRLFIIFKII